MKALAVLIVSLVSFQTFATGSVYCESKNAEFTIEASVARMYGNPVIGDIYITLKGESIILNKEQLVNYWSDADSLKMLILDDNFNLPRVKLEAKRTFLRDTQKGIVTIDDQEFKIICTY
ncbi:hypothetical protein [Halobacteriovorax sp. JY17]|uniref:hypothetical protein n=1 Tax=Halobacteriovorax sp. JY17 TaxID=2014617 RepID=UPI000C64B9F4|nr:hypothetical protein [Halobacteriovorax sp. JY17]PIK14944.1 MAG: hypothetical protein CES88_11465 [Halobacteriovorax sp. JY17]